MGGNAIATIGCGRGPRGFQHCGQPRALVVARWRWRRPPLSATTPFLVATNHDGIDDPALVADPPLVIETDNVCGRSGVRGSNGIEA